MNEQPMKRCSVCGETFLATTEHFIPNKRNKSGLGGRCRPCEFRIRKAQAAARHEQFLQGEDFPASKTCSICGIEYPATFEHFYRRIGAKDGLRNECRTCLTARNERWKERNPERVHRNGLTGAANYRSRHHAKVLRANHQWKANNKDKITKYRKDRLDVFANYQRKRRTQEKGLPNVFAPADWQYALDYFGGCCAVCERPLNGLFHEAAADHWIPLSNPECPGTIRENIVPLCHQVGGCNNSKGSSNPEEWLTKRFGKRKAKLILARIHAYFDHVRSLELND